MTDDQDSEFEKYLAGGSSLSDAYAGLPDAEPPAYLDYAIRDEAHRVVGAGAATGRLSARARLRDASSGWRAWQKWAMPLSVAATLVIVAMVGLQLPYITGQAPEPAAAPAAPGGVTSESRQPVSVKSSSVAKPEAGGAAALQDRVRGNVAGQQAQAAKGRAPAEKHAEFFQETKPTPAEAAPEATRRAEPAAPPAAMKAAPAPAAEIAAPAAALQEAPAAQATGGAPQQQAPGPWLARIRKLKQEGRQAEAKQALAAFSRRYPKYPVPEDLRDLRQGQAD